MLSQPTTQSHTNLACSLAKPPAQGDDVKLPETPVGGLAIALPTDQRQISEFFLGRNVNIPTKMIKAQITTGKGRT